MGEMGGWAKTTDLGAATTGCLRHHRTDSLSERLRLPQTRPRTPPQRGWSRGARRRPSDRPRRRAARGAPCRTRRCRRRRRAGGLRWAAKKHHLLTYGRNGVATYGKTGCWDVLFCLFWYGRNGVATYGKTGCWDVCFCLFWPEVGSAAQPETSIITYCDAYRQVVTIGREYLHIMGVRGGRRIRKMASVILC